MFGFPVVDIAVIAAYFTAVVAIGIRSMRRIHNQEDYFLAGRRFGKFIQTFAAFGQATSADTCVGVTTTTATNGAAGIWSSLIYLFATPLYWLVMPWMRRLRLLTLGDFFEERYGSKPMAAAYAVIGSVGMMAIISVGFSAMTKTVVAMVPKSVDQLAAAQAAEYELAVELDGLRAADYETLSPPQRQRLADLEKKGPRKLFSHLDENVLIWAVCLIVVVYAVAGGLEAAFLTDTVQGIFIILLSVMLIPFAMARINLVYGGSGPADALATVHARLPQSFFEVFGSPAAIDFTWYYIAALAVMGTINVVIQPNSIVATGSAKTEYECRFGFVVGNFMKRFCIVFWSFFALMAVVLYGGQVGNPDLLWGYAARELLGSLGIGLAGLMAACLMAALMSTADCLMITCSGLLTHNIYRPLVTGRSERHYVFVSRIIGAFVVVGGALIATGFDSILQILKFMWEVNVMVAASFWLGMKWRRANRPAAWCSIVTTAVLFFVLPLLLPFFSGGLRASRYLLKTTAARPVARVYVASGMDAENRQAAIERWERLNGLGLAAGPRPAPLRAGERFEQAYVMPEKSVFWTKGLKAGDNGRLTGRGMLNLELVLLDRLGFDLSRNPYALNETIRILIRTAFPFVLLVAVALLTAPDEKARLDRFFVKMKTPVLHDRRADEIELEKSYARPHRFDGRKIFPGSDWEFDMPTRTDTTGFLAAVAGVFAVIGLFMLLLSL
jgi:SSS family solute:Na+ symporter